MAEILWFSDFYFIPSFKNIRSNQYIVVEIYYDCTLSLHL